MLSVFVARQPVRLRRALAIGAALAALYAPSPGVAQDMSLADGRPRVAIGDPAVAANAARLQVADAAITSAAVQPRDVCGVDASALHGPASAQPIDHPQTT